MEPFGPYSGARLVGRYDQRHFGGSGGRHVFRKDRHILISLLPSPSSLILDVPCGTGIYSETLRAAGYRVIAADASLPMLQAGRQRLSGISCSVSDIGRLPFTDDSLDCIMIIRLFQHYPGDQILRVLHESRRVIRSGGLVVFDTFRWSPRRVPLLKSVLKGDMYVYAHQDVKRLLSAADLMPAESISAYLFSPIWYRKLPSFFLHALDGVETILPGRWLLRTFWGCTKA